MTKPSCSRSWRRGAARRSIRPTRGSSRSCVPPSATGELIVAATGWAAAAGARALTFVDALPSGDATWWIDGPDGHHLQRVRRLAVGETVVLADGVGRWLLTRIAEDRDGCVGVVPVGAPHEEPRRTPELTVAFAPAK